MIKYDNVSGFKTLPFYENSDLKGYYMEDLLEENLVHNKKMGFLEKNVTNIDKKSIVGINEYHGLGKKCYGFPINYDEYGVKILKKSFFSSANIIIMDELGFFERKSKKFTKEVFKILKSDKRVLGVIKKRRNEFLDGVVNLENVKVIEVTLSNRDKILDEIILEWGI
ncbi:hypothetical protein HLPR_12140 [Helicovermis profundi]|uniref:Uncharacterized protein n=1 Tax=Helicovermis profundi TaxID=3065157 RepID=A0AAU9E3D5_9FIRM|nr:hypothetical protein HLPR_12140 [Clostridia bacterium S502]